MVVSVFVCGCLLCCGCVYCALVCVCVYQLCPILTPPVPCASSVGHPHRSPFPPQGDLFQEETYVGRAKDKKPTPHEGGKSDPASRVKLEYRWVLAVRMV